MAIIIDYLFNQSIQIMCKYNAYSCRSNEHYYTPPTLIGTHNSSVLTTQLDNNIICHTFFSQARKSLYGKMIIDFTVFGKKTCF